jgi:peptidoglycan/xylan/chitin deacetylase (PgdA/CDA1 family)
MLIVCYHAVSDDWDHQLAVRHDAFRRQLSGLRRRGLRPVSAAAAVHGRGRLFHVTFDDAYASVRSAVPVLESMGVPATIFAVSSYADDGRPLDVPELAADAAESPEHLATMTWEELRELAGRGFEIGSHTRSHPHLPELSDDELDDELTGSRARFEDELGRPCRFLAYPYGEHDERVRAAAERAGYEAAFALWPGADGGNRFALPRAGFYREDSLVRALLKTTFASKAAAGALAIARKAKGS